MQSWTIGIYVTISATILIQRVRGTIDVNLSEFEYLAARLDPFECRRLIAALHYTTYDLPKNLAAAGQLVIFKSRQTLACYYCVVNSIILFARRDLTNARLFPAAKRAQGGRGDPVSASTASLEQFPGGGPGKDARGDYTSTSTAESQRSRRLARQNRLQTTGKGSGQCCYAVLRRARRGRNGNQHVGIPRC